MTVQLGQDLRFGKIESDQFAVKPGAEAASTGYQIDGFQQIGLSLGVFTEDHIGVVLKFKGLPVVIAESVENDLTDFHLS